VEKKFSFPSLFSIVLFFILGIVLAYFIKLNFNLIALLILINFFLLLIIKKLSLYLILSISFFLGILRFENARTLPKNNIVYQIREKKRENWFKLKVNSYIEGKGKRFIFLADVISLLDKDVWLSTSGKIRCYIFGKEPSFNYGDILLSKGILIKEEKSSSPIQAILILKSYQIIKKSKHPFNYLFSLRKKLNQIINENLPYPHQAILSALILGERQRVPKEIEENFIRTGTIHILAISGLHVGMIVYLGYLFLKILRFPRQFAYLLLIVFVFLYSILTGAKPPVMRASLMSGVYLGGLLIKREGNILNSLSLACWIILLIQPYQLFHVGFQLSFLVVLSIIISLFLTQDWFKKEAIEIKYSRKERIKRYFLKMFILSLSAWLGSAGLIAYYFKMVNPIAILANLIVIPLTFFILASGIIFLLFSPCLGEPFLNTNFLFIELLLKFIKYLSKLPGGFFILSHFSFPGVILYYFFLLIAIFLTKRRSL